MLTGARRKGNGLAERGRGIILPGLVERYCAAVLSISKAKNKNFGRGVGRVLVSLFNPNDVGIVERLYRVRTLLQGPLSRLRLKKHHPHIVALVFPKTYS